MTEKTFITTGAIPPSQIGATLEALMSTIQSRRDSGNESSYTNRLIHGPLDSLLKKVSEESLETCLAAKESDLYKNLTNNVQTYDTSIDHMRYEAADVVYHLLVLLARFDITIDEFAAELNTRMQDNERPEGAIMLKPEHIRRGK